MAKKPATKAPEPTKQEQVADLSSKLNSLLNESKKTAAADPCAEIPSKKAASRSNFKGELIVPNASGGIIARIPIKTYVATDTDKIERNMFHGVHTVLSEDGKTEETKTCLGQLKQAAMFCEACNTTVEKSAAQYGVRVGAQVVFVSDAELKAQQPLADQKMKIIEYVDETQINPVYYEDAEFVCADGTATELLAFAGLREGLKRTGKVAKGVRIKGGREQYFTLRPYGQHGLTMHYLRAEYEIRSCDKWSPIAVNEDVAQLFAALIEVSAVPQFVAAPQDTYLANSRRFIKQKAAGVEVEIPKAEPEQTAPADLMAALKATIEQSKKKASAAKAGK